MLWFNILSLESTCDYHAKCPNCGAVLELPEYLDRAFCNHCGGKVIIGKDETHYHTHQAQKTAIACPECSGKGYFICHQCNGGMRCTAYYTVVRDGRQYFEYCYAGWCPRCKGKGEIIDFLFKTTCTFCNGSKVCPYCRGTNKCATCRGTGSIACRACKGSGFKVYRGD